MGRVEEDWDAPVTKTTGGLLLFKRTHPLIQRRSLTPERQLKLARAVCCQCNQCTQMCPRNALGLHVQPHKAMRALAMGNGALLGGANGVLACSSCGLCTNYACNMGLTPSEVMAMLKAELNKAGVRPQPEEEIVPDPFVEFKRVPVKRLIARMGLSAYDTPAPYRDGEIAPQRVVLPLSQHVGRPAVPVVKQGDQVRRGDLIAAIPEGALGAALHASIDGVVAAVDGQRIEITGGGAA